METTLINISLDAEKHLHLFVHKWLWVLSLLAALVFIVRLFSRRRSISESFEIDTAELGIGDSKIVFKPNYADKQIAYKLWVEVNTRKIGLPIDLQHDVIVEIYDSWYEFFAITRELIKDIPIQKISKHESTRTLVDIAINVLNDALRPHLTKWQAKFRAWHTKEKERHPALTPQQLQATYPEYQELVAELMTVNQKLISYQRLLRKVSLGERSTHVPH